jgi:hypothetical protein
MDRRSFLTSAGATILPLVTSARPALAALKPRPKNAPRYLVRIHTMGGMDSVVTTDPKRKSEVEPWVDVPFESKAIVDAGGVPLGPLFADLKKWPRAFTVLNGIAVGVANHESGLIYASRFRTRITEKTPTLFDIFGSYRDGQPLSSISLGAGLVQQYSPTAQWFGTGAGVFGPLGKDLLQKLDAADPDDLKRMARVLRKQASELQAVSAPGDATATAMSECAALFERLPQVPAFKPEGWPEGAPDFMSLPLQRAIWAIENDLTAGVFANVGYNGVWDSHFDVHASQEEAVAALLPQVERFFSELEKRKNAWGTLADNTLVVIGSELGRFPRLNEMMGKDHFPETFHLFSGRWFASGARKWSAFGQTDRRMAALPIDVRTGRAKPGGHVVTLDDVGATLLEISGIDAELHGYTGTVLPFLLRS